MRRDNEQSIGEVIKAFLKRNQLSERYQEKEIVGRWEEIMGAEVAQKTRTVRFKDGLLDLQLNSSTLRQEMMYRQQETIDRLNQHLGKEVVKRIRLR